MSPSTTQREQVRSAVPGAVTLENIDVREVAAHA
jgi:hypothetical protein